MAKTGEVTQLQLAEIAGSVPGGWQVEELIHAGCVLVRSPTGLMVTLDLAKRGLRSGLSSHGMLNEATPGAPYTGRGWLQRLTADAVAHLQEVERGDAGKKGKKPKATSGSSKRGR